MCSNHLKPSLLHGKIVINKTGPCKKRLGTAAIRPSPVAIPSSVWLQAVSPVPHRTPSLRHPILADQTPWEEAALSPSSPVRVFTFSKIPDYKPEQKIWFLISLSHHTFRSFKPHKKIIILTLKIFSPSLFPLLFETVVLPNCISFLLTSNRPTPTISLTLCQQKSPSLLASLKSPPQFSCAPFYISKPVFFLSGVLSSLLTFSYPCGYFFLAS